MQSKCGIIITSGQTILLMKKDKFVKFLWQNDKCKRISSNFISFWKIQVL